LGLSGSLDLSAPLTSSAVYPISVPWITGGILAPWTHGHPVLCLLCLPYCCVPESLAFSCICFSRPEKVPSQICCWQESETR